MIYIIIFFIYYVLSFFLYCLYLYRFFFCIFTGVNASRDIYRLVATLMVLFRVRGWSRRETFGKCSLLSKLHDMESELTSAAENGTVKCDPAITAAAARYCIQVCISVYLCVFGVFLFHTA